jgi:hypothetical protein
MKEHLISNGAEYYAALPSTDVYAPVSISSNRILLGACRWHLCGLLAGFRHTPLADPS